MPARALLSRERKTKNESATDDAERNASDIERTVQFERNAPRISHRRTEEEEGNSKFVLTFCFFCEEEERVAE